MGGKTTNTVLEAMVDGTSAHGVPPDVLAKIENSGFYRTGSFKEIGRKKISDILSELAASSNYGGIRAIRDAMARHVAKSAQTFGITISQSEIERTANRILYDFIDYGSQDVREFYIKATGFEAV